MTTPGDIRSNNADMSNDKSCDSRNGGNISISKYLFNSKLSSTIQYFNGGNQLLNKHRSTIRCIPPNKNKAQDQSIISQKKVAHLTYVSCLMNISNKDIINWFANLVRGFLSYYRYCDNFYQIWTIVDYHICWSAIFTLANKHKSSTRKIIPKHSKDLHIVNGEGGTFVSFPTSIESKITLI